MAKRSYSGKSDSGLTRVAVDMDTVTGKGWVRVYTYGELQQTIQLPGEQLARDDTPTRQG